MNSYNHLDEFTELLRMGQSELKRHLAKLLKEQNYSPVSQKGFLYAAGSVPILLVAHLDTVHQAKPEIICFSEDGRYLMSPQGIGGDDRCGVYMILQIIKAVNCHVLFCEDEEIGGNGARAFSRSRIKPKLHYIVEMDRRGSNDAVFYDCCNTEFTDFILSFGFEEGLGSFSDISVVAPYLETAAVNLSAGYYNEHRLHESIDMIAVQYNIQRVIQMAETPSADFPYVRRKSSYRQLSFLKGQRTLFDLAESGGYGHKMLMALPDTARIITNGCEFTPKSAYMIDHENNAYVYLDELGAAVESEHSYVCDENGDPISFSLLEAKRFPVLSMEEALEQLSLKTG